jgi:branched-chain amino acid transport system permease protein
MPRPLLRVALFLGLAALAVFPLVATKFQLQLIAAIMVTAIYAMSLDLLVGFTGIVSLGHAAFFGLAAYALWFFQAGSLWLSLPLSMAVAAAAALAIGLLSLRSSGVYLIMVTLAFSQMLFYYATGSSALGGSDGAYIDSKPRAVLFGAEPFHLQNRLHFYYFALALLALVYLVLARILRAPFGRVIIGIRSNEQRVRSLGFPVFRYKLVAFVIAGAIAGLAGYLHAAQFGFVSPDLFGWRESGKLLMIVILGGMGTLWGPVVGAFALTLLEQFLPDYTKHWPLPLGLFIILAVLLLPRGIAGLADLLDRRKEARLG